MLPKAYSGETSCEDWAFHFENVATVNEWSAAQKLQWLRVRLRARAIGNVPKLCPKMKLLS